MLTRMRRLSIASKCGESVHDYIPAASGPNSSAVIALLISGGLLRSLDASECGSAPFGRKLCVVAAESFHAPFIRT
jgi:hypothetical protein